MRACTGKTGRTSVVTLAVVSAIAFFGLAGPAAASHNTIPSGYFVVTDSGGANDVNASQVDLTQMGRDDTDAGTYKLFWSWDATDDWTGAGQTGDACALFDTDGDTNVNYAVCARITNPGADPSVVNLTADSPFLFLCSDGKDDRCTHPEQILLT